MRKTHRHPLEQRAYEAWRDMVLTTGPGSDENLWRWEYANWQAVKEGRAEPLPQYRKESNA